MVSEDAFVSLFFSYLSFNTTPCLNLCGCLEVCWHQAPLFRGEASWMRPELNREWNRGEETPSILGIADREKVAMMKRTPCFMKSVRIDDFGTAWHVLLDFVVRDAIRRNSVSVSVDAGSPGLLVGFLLLSGRGVAGG
jgi:hypothetical protein